MDNTEIQLNMDLDENSKVYQSNDIAMAKYDIGMLEQKVWLTLLATVKKDDKEFNGIKLKVTDLANMLGVSRQYLYQNLKQVCENIIDKKFEVLSKNGRTWTKYNMMSFARYDDKDGTISLKLNDDVKPYILELTRNFSSFSLSRALELSNKYSLRVYQFAKANAYRGEFTLDLDDFRERMYITAPTYAKPAQLIKKIMTPVMDEINSLTDIEVKVEYIKTGKKTTHGKFTVTEKNICDVKVKPKVAKQPKLDKYGKPSKFQNFETHNYNYEEIEKGLLGLECDVNNLYQK